MSSPIKYIQIRKISWNDLIMLIRLTNVSFINISFNSPTRLWHFSTPTLPPTSSNYLHCLVSRSLASYFRSMDLCVNQLPKFPQFLFSNVMLYNNFIKRISTINQRWNNYSNFTCSSKWALIRSVISMNLHMLEHQIHAITI